MYVKLSKAASAEEAHLHYKGIWHLTFLLFHFLDSWRQAALTREVPLKRPGKKTKQKQIALNEDIIPQENENC